MKTKLILEIVLPIISLIAMIILFTQFYSSSQEKIEGIQKKLDVATSDVIKVCYDFKQRQNQIKNDYGRLSYAYESFINRNRADLDGCENEIPKIIQSCRDKPEYKNFESCRDERLNSYYQNIQLVENNENLPNCGPGTHVEQGICIPNGKHDYCDELNQLQSLYLSRYGSDSEEFHYFVQRYGETLQSCYSR